MRGGSRSCLLQALALLALVARAAPGPPQTVAGRGEAPRRPLRPGAAPLAGSGVGSCGGGGSRRTVLRLRGGGAPEPESEVLGSSWETATDSSEMEMRRERGEPNKEDEEDREWEARAVERMRQLAETAKEGKADVVDGYSLLQDIREEEGKAITLPIYNELLMVCAEACKHARAETLDGERIFEQLADEGLKPNATTYENMLELIANGAGQIPQKGFLSEAYEWLQNMCKEMNATDRAGEMYMLCYNNQWPNVIDIDQYELNWGFLDSEEDRLWTGDPDRGIPPDPSGDWSLKVHVDDLKDIPIPDDARYSSASSSRTPSPGLVDQETYWQDEGWKNTREVSLPSGSWEDQEGESEPPKNKMKDWDDRGWMAPPAPSKIAGRTRNL